MNRHQQVQPSPQYLIRRSNPEAKDQGFHWFVDNIFGAIALLLITLLTIVNFLLPALGHASEKGVANSGIQSKTQFDAAEKTH